MNPAPTTLLKKLSRPRVIVLVAVAALVLAVSLVAAAFYYSDAAGSLAKDQEILRLRSQLLAQNVTILKLELEIVQLDANLTTLNQRVAVLALNQTFNGVEMAFLRSQVSTLENETARLSLELAVAEQVGNLSVSTYAANETLTVRPNTIAQVTSQANGHNGTLVFYSQNGCLASGDKVQTTSGQYELYILLNSTGRPMMSDFKTLTGQPYTVYLENVGPAQVQCTFSILYVQH